MLKNVENEKVERNINDNDLDDLSELLKALFPTSSSPERRVSVSLSLLLKGYTVDELVADLGDRDVANNVSDLLAAGADPDKLVSRLAYEDVVERLDKLLDAGAHVGINSIVAKLDDSYIINRLAGLLKAGADPSKLVNKLNSKDIAYYLNELLSAGAEIDVNELVSQLTPRSIVDNLDELRAAGAKIDVERLLKKASPAMVRDNFGQLLRAGAVPDSLLKCCKDSDVVDRYAGDLLSAGANADLLVSKLSSYGVANNVSDLLAAGADVNVLMDRLSAEQVAENLSTLLAASAQIDVDDLVQKIADSRYSYFSKKAVVELLRTGVDPNELIGIGVTGGRVVVECLPELMAAGADKDKLGCRLEALQHFDFTCLLENLDVIRVSGASIVTPEVLMRKLEELDCVDRVCFFEPGFGLDALLRFGVDPDRLAIWASGDRYLLDTCGWGTELLKAGANPEILLQSCLDSSQ